MGPILSRRYLKAKKHKLKFNFRTLVLSVTMLVDVESRVAFGQIVGDLKYVQADVCTLLQLDLPTWDSELPTQRSNRVLLV